MSEHPIVERLGRYQHDLEQAHRARAKLVADFNKELATVDGKVDELTNLRDQAACFLWWAYASGRLDEVPSGIPTTEELGIVWLMDDLARLHAARSERAPVEVKTVTGQSVS